MEPYRWDSIDDEKKKIEYPVFTWDWYQIGGRYSAYLKLKVDIEDSENREHYNWRYLKNNPRNERLFHSALLSELKRNAKVPFAYTEESYFPNMGCEIEHQHPKYKPGRRSQFSFNVSLYYFFSVSVHQLAPLGIGVYGFNFCCISHFLNILSLAFPRSLFYVFLKNSVLLFLLELFKVFYSLPAFFSSVFDRLY